MKLSPLEESSLKYRGIDVLSIKGKHRRVIDSVYGVSCSSTISWFKIINNRTEETGHFFERRLQGMLIWSKILFRKKNEKTGNYIRAKGAFEMLAQMIFVNQSKACDKYYDEIEQENEFVNAAKSSTKKCSKCDKQLELLDVSYRRTLKNKTKERNYRGFTLSSFEKREIDVILRSHLCFLCTAELLKAGHDNMRAFMVKNKGGKKVVVFNKESRQK